MELNIKYKIYAKTTIYLAFIISIIAIIFTGCNKSNSKKLISYSSTANINNLDPQTASSPEETTIITNIFEGLYKKAPDASYIPGMAKKIDKDEKNKIYTFTLRDDIYWRAPKSYSSQNKIKVTAKDFVFAFKRLMDPNTNSQAAPNYFFIKNAKKIKQGQLPLNKLGIIANSENKLTIYLEYDCPIFEKLMSCPPASPCNEAFFKHTNGRYGTSKETIMTNGPFFLSSWEESKYKIRISDKYYDSKKIKIIGVNFSVRQKSEILDMLQKKEITTAILNSQEFFNIDQKNFENKKFQNAVTGIVFNDNNPIFKNNKIKLGIASSVEKEKISDILTKHQILAESLIPNSVHISQKESYNEKKSKKSYSPNNIDKKTAKKLFIEGLKEVQSKNEDLNLNSSSVLLDSSKSSVINKILQKWQKNLAIFPKIDSKNQKAYEKKLKSKKFDIAILTISSDFDSPSSILSKFLPDSPYNYMNYNIEELQKTIDEASIQEDINSMAEKFLEAEKIILDGGYFIPLYFETEYFVFNDKVSGILFDAANRQFYYAYSDMH